jgi:hypothetical protein
VGVVAGALIVAALVGGALRTRSQSAGYERAIDGSYAAQARLIAQGSNRQGRALFKLLAEMAGDGRTTLEEALDTLVRSTASLARRAATAASPAPSGGAGADVTAAMVDRGDAMRVLRTTVDRLLGMAPLPVVGATDPSPPATPRPISAARAAAQLAKVGTLLARSDRTYAAGRRALRSAPGRARLPSSVWSGRRAAWTASGTVSEVDALTSSPTLAAVHKVELVAHALALTPAPVPLSAAGSAPTVLVIPPTGRIGVGLVVANDGNVAERGIVVRVTVTPGEGGGARPEGSRRVGLAPDSSVTVTLPPVRVVPDKSYRIAVSVDPPLANVQGTVTSDTVSVRVAPPGPPTVSQLLPAKGPEVGGTSVTVLGSGFTWVSGVTFGTAPAHFKIVSSSEIIAAAPPGKGTVAVHVTNPGGASATSGADRFSYDGK